LYQADDQGGELATSASPPEPKDDRQARDTGGPGQFVPSQRRQRRGRAAAREPANADDHLSDGAEGYVNNAPSGPSRRARRNQRHQLQTSVNLEGFFKADDGRDSEDDEGGKGGGAKAGGSVKLMATESVTSFAPQPSLLRTPKSHFRELTKKQKIHEFYAAPVTKFWAHAVSCTVLVHMCNFHFQEIYKMY
jgi:hypothetical protein